jgi:ATP-dependent exoDNAse (exonuclease V) beta subunit
LKDIVEWKKVAEVFLTGSGTLRKQFGPRYGFPDGFGMDPAVMLIKTLPLIEAKRLAFVAKWPDPQEDNVGLAALMDILILASGAITKLQELIRTQGMDYLELEMGALRALGQTDRPSEGLIFHHEHLRHILVDEAQDMNEIQVEILSRLTEGWEPGDGRTVFVVGDPKQSIYRFRRAEVIFFME